MDHHIPPLIALTLFSHRRSFFLVCLIIAAYTESVIGKERKEVETGKKKNAVRSCCYCDGCVSGAAASTVIRLHCSA